MTQKRLSLVVGGIGNASTNVVVQTRRQTVGIDRACVGTSLPLEAVAERQNSSERLETVVPIEFHVEVRALAEKAQEGAVTERLTQGLLGLSPHTAPLLGGSKEEMEDRVGLLLISVETVESRALADTRLQKAV